MSTNVALYGVAFLYILVISAPSIVGNIVIKLLTVLDGYSSVPLNVAITS
jgi:hypothetical protein